MYNSIFGSSIELQNDFESQSQNYFPEFQNTLGEVPTEKPYEFCDFIKNSGGEEKKVMDFKTGTTTLAFVFKEGVIMAVDSRASMGHYVSSETVRKVIEISGQKLATIAGGAADCQYWEAWLSQEVRMFELRHGKQPSVAATSRMMVNLINYYKRYGLSMGLMLAGCDEGKPQLYYINTEGSRIKGNLFSVGSGMTFAYGVLDTFYRYDMSLDEAVELGKKAIYHATNRDTGSGGVVRVYHVHKDGWTEKVAGDDVNKYHYKFRQDKGFEEDKSRGKL